MFVMNKKLHKSLLILLTVTLVVSSYILTEKSFSIDPALWKAMGLDPNADSSWESYKGETEDQLNAVDLDGDGWITPEEIQAVNNGTAGSYKANKAAPAASTPSVTVPTTSSSKGKSGKAQESKKITVYFTDLYGHVIGSSQVTAGTTIADGQFPKTVEDIDGHSFDKWDYDGKEMYHDYIVRALYK